MSRPEFRESSAFLDRPKKRSTIVNAPQELATAQLALPRSRRPSDGTSPSSYSTLSRTQELAAAQLALPGSSLCSNPTLKREGLKTVGRLKFDARKESRIKAVDNTPQIFSVYDDSTARRWISMPKLLSNRVHIPWYRRYAGVLPETERIGLQPYREINTREEDIALQHSYGTHECMSEYVQRQACKIAPQECNMIRKAAMARYSRLKMKEEKKKQKIYEEKAQAPDFGKDIDYTTAFGYSARTQSIVQPVVDFLQKLQTLRDRKMARISLKKNSKWRILHGKEAMEKIYIMVLQRRRAKVRARLHRIFRLVLWVDRFIKCVAMISGNTRHLMRQRYSGEKTKQDGGLSSRPSRLNVEDMPVFNAKNYHRSSQVKIPFDLRLILSKPWYCRSAKEVGMTVKFLQKMRSFANYPNSFQIILAKCAWYIEIPPQKVIIRQSQPAVNFYILFSGQVRIDRLQGSPVDGCEGYFKPLKKIVPHEIFGDECITEPFSERTYTATSEDRCTMLDFNMHDYNTIIRTFATSEVAPDHIRFLCKLKIMEKFPKMDLVKDEDNNITFFYFRAGMMICKSVKDSPFIFVVRNGSCSILVEHAPKRHVLKHQFTRATDFDSGTAEELEKTPEPIKRPQTPDVPSDENLFEGILRRLTSEDRHWFISTKAAFDMNKGGMKTAARDYQKKVERITSTLSSTALRQFNLDMKTKSSTMVAVAQKSEPRLGKSKQSVRWDDDDDDFKGSKVSSEFESDVIKRKSSRGLFRTSGSKIVGSSIEFLSAATYPLRSSISERSNMEVENTNNSNARGQYNKSKTSKTRFPTLSTETKGKGKLRRPMTSVIRKEGHVSNPRGQNQEPKPSKIRIPAPPTEPSGKNRARRPMTSVLHKEGHDSYKQCHPVAPEPPKKSHGLKLPSLSPSDTKKHHAPSQSARVSKEDDEGNIINVVSDPDHFSDDERYSYWTEKAFLTVTDTVGNEWLDYNDGTYKKPTVDYALVSHGATVIMIKKEFMLKHLRKAW